VRSSLAWTRTAEATRTPDMSGQEEDESAQSIGALRSHAQASVRSDRRRPWRGPLANGEAAVDHHAPAGAIAMLKLSKMNSATSRERVSLPLANRRHCEWWTNSNSAEVGMRARALKHGLASRAVTR